MKDFIFDNEKIRRCASNFAKMNIFEYFYYFGWKDWKTYFFGLSEYWKEVLVFFVRIIVLPISPFLIFYVAYKRIKEAKKLVKNN